MKHRSKVLFLLLGALLGGCASAPVPQQQLVQSQAALRAAEELGVPGTPEAELHLQLAREQIRRANELIEDGENERARYMLLRAESDAELALALSREQAMQNEAREAMEKVRKLQLRTQ